MSTSRLSTFLISTVFAASTLALAFYLQFIMPAQALRRRRRKVRKLLNVVESINEMAVLDCQDFVESSKTIHRDDIVDRTSQHPHHVTDVSPIKTPVQWLPFDRLQFLRELSSMPIFRMNHRLISTQMAQFILTVCIFVGGVL